MVADSADPIRVAYTLLQCWHRVPGGTATSMVSLAAALAARSDVDLVGVGPRARREPSDEVRPPVPVRHLSLPYQLVYDVWHHSRFLAPESVTGPVDLVHATTTTVPPVRPGTPLVVTVHDLFPLLEPDVLTRRGARILSRGIELTRERAAVVFCPSEQTASDCRRFGVPPDRVRVVPWAATPREVSPAQQAAVLDRHGLPRPFVLWVGTVEPRKNLATLLAAWRDVSADADLVLVGPRGWGDDLDALIGSLARVHRIGFVERADLDGLYRAAEFVCVPSIREGFGLPAIEAMVQGTPVIGARGTAVEEVVGDTGVLVDPLDVDGWADAIAALLADRDRREDLGHRAALRAAGYTWAAAAEATVEGYRAALGESS